MLVDGKRVYLREVREEDAGDEYYAWMNDLEVTKYLEGRFRPVSRESLKEYVKSYANDPNNVFLAIVLTQGDRHIGNIKLGPINWVHRTAEIGIMIGAKDCWGKGYATEAISLISEYAFETLNLHKVTAGCYAPNEGSQKAFLNAGFVQEGVRKEQNFFDGHYIDGVLFGLLRGKQKVK